MKKAFRVIFVCLWAAVCIALILMLADWHFGAFQWSEFQFGGFQMNNWSIRGGVSLKSELIYQESVSSRDMERLEVKAYSESVRVFAVDGGEFAVRQYGPVDTLREELVRVSREDGVLRVIMPARTVVQIGVFFANPRLEIDVPREWFGGVDISTSSGSQTLEDGFSWKSASLGASSGAVRLLGPLTLEGAAQVSASSGSVRLQDLTAASAALKTTSGALTVEGRLTLTGNLEAAASSGSVRLNRTEAAQVQVSANSGALHLGEMKAESVRARTSSGSLRAVTLETASFDLQTNSGGIHVGALTGGGRLKATSGTVTVLTLRPTGNVDARASSGGVRLTIPEDCSFTFEARCSSGRIRSDYALYYQGRNERAAAYTHGGGGPAVSAETTSGSIRLGK
ncbi:MAG: DUF4097 domain-containing protein [Oscillospiraceae bacterium]|nr:DUF4097 domain-containing protein [Oscillospiraceae bacterium]